MCNKNANRCESTTKKDVDEWLDGEGKFHRKIVIETVTNPINTRDAVNPNKKIGFPGFFRQDPCFPEFRFRGFQDNQEFKFPDPEQFFGNNMSDKPLIDFKKIIEQGKTLLEKMGIDIKDVDKSAEELVKEVKKENPKQENPKEEKPITEGTPNIVGEKNKPEIKPETKPLNQKKEVEKCQKKQIQKKTPKIQKMKTIQKMTKKTPKTKMIQKTIQKTKKR